MKLFILSLLILFSSNAFSLESEEDRYKNRETVKYLKPTGLTDQKMWTIKISSKDSLEHIELFKNKEKKPTLSYTAELLTHSFMGGRIIKFKEKRYFVTKWTSGAHSEETLLFDLNLKEPKAIWFYISAWPARLEVSDKELTVFGTGDRDPKTSEPKVQIVKWNPSMKPMDFSLESEASQSSKSE